MIKMFKEVLPTIAKSTYVAEDANMIGDCKIGEDCSIWFGVTIRADVNYIRIGDRTSIQDGSVIHVSHSTKQDKSDGFPTIIGDDVTVGHKAMLHGCKIENACMIGMTATLLDGSEIGTESIVAAGSVVTQNKKFPPRSLIMGIPAKVVRLLSEKEIEGIYQSAQNYVEYKDEYLQNTNKN